MYKINPKILQTPIEQGNILLLEPATGLYFELSQVSVIVFQGIIAGLREEDILESITSIYQVDKDQAKEDMTQLIEQFLEKQIFMR